MYTLSPLFIFKIIFSIEIFIIEFFLSFSLKKRKNFIIRFLISSIIYFLLVLSLPIPFSNAYYTTFLFLITFIFSLFPLFISFEEKILNILFIAFFSYSLQHISYAANQLILVGTGLNSIGSIGNYGSEQIIFDKQNSSQLICFFIEIECFLFITFIGIFIFQNKIKRTKGLNISNIGLFSFSGIMILVAIIINSIVVYNENLHTKSILLLFYFLSMNICIIAFVLEFSLDDMKHLQKELQIVKMMWDKDRDHYELSSQAIKMLNVKYHDLKHQIENMKNVNDLSANALSSLEKYVNTYDSVISTGNHALDVVLTEKTLFCHDKSIQLTSLVDGKLLNFMENVDIYSFFDNAISNAIREVSSYSNSDQKFIRITLKNIEYMIHIHIENYCNHQIKIKNGLIKSTKEDKENHGYGLLSMQTTIEKYNGDMYIHQANSMFMVDVLIPLNTNKK